MPMGKINELKFRRPFHQPGSSSPIFFLFFFLFEEKKEGYLYQEKLNTPQLKLTPVVLRILYSPTLFKERL